MKALRWVTSNGLFALRPGVGSPERAVEGGELLVRAERARDEAPVESQVAVLQEERRGAHVRFDGGGGYPPAARGVVADVRGEGGGCARSVVRGSEEQPREVPHADAENFPNPLAEYALFTLPRSERSCSGVGEVPKHTAEEMLDTSSCGISTRRSTCEDQTGGGKEQESPAVLALVRE